MRPDIDYAVVLVDLAARARSLGDVAAFVDRRLQLAALVQALPSDVGPACYAACGDLATAQHASRWLRAAAPGYARLHTPRRDLAPPAVAPARRFVLAPALVSLPLVELAEDLAGAQPNRTLEVSVTSLQTQHCLGVTWFLPDRTAVHLDLDRIAERGRSVESVWAHELGHVLSPRGFRIDDEEAFADAAGEILLQLRPSTASDARAATAHLLPATLTDEARVVQVEEILTFEQLDLGDGDLESDVAAYRSARAALLRSSSARATSNPLEPTGLQHATRGTP